MASFDISLAWDQPRVDIVDAPPFGCALVIDDDTDSVTLRFADAELAEEAVLSWLALFAARREHEESRPTLPLEVNR